MKAVIHGDNLRRAFVTFNQLTHLSLRFVTSDAALLIPAPWWRGETWTKANFVQFEHPIPPIRRAVFRTLDQLSDRKHRVRIVPRTRERDWFWPTLEVRQKLVLAECARGAAYLAIMDQILGELSVAQAANDPVEEVFTDLLVRDKHAATL